jgi:hypothetical protein
MAEVKPPQIPEHKTAIVACPGHDFDRVREEVEWARQERGVPVVGINRAYQLTSLDYWCGVDVQKFFDSAFLSKEVPKFICQGNASNYRAYPNVVGLPYAGGPKDASSRFCDGKLPICRSYNRGLLFGLHVCSWMGFKNLLIVGSDFKMPDMKLYPFSKDKISEAHKTKREVTIFARVIQGLREGTPTASKFGVRLINCSKGGPLDEFMETKGVREAVEELVR